MFVKVLVSSLALCALFASDLVAGREVPANLKALYDNAKSKRCASPLSSVFEDGQGNSGWVYCGDYLKSKSAKLPNRVPRGTKSKSKHIKPYPTNGTMPAPTNGTGAGTGTGDFIFISGPSDSSPFADMDIDCDGANRMAGACSNDGSGQSQTSFKGEVKGYGIEDLDANKHSYVVLGNEGSSPKFDPSSVGIEPLSVVAVVCNNQLLYGVWGDTNGGKIVGEASISLAQACFPTSKITGDSGHSAHDVLYIAFTGPDAKPGKSGAKWNANSFAEFEQSLAAIGDKLVSRISA